MLNEQAVRDWIVAYIADVCGLEPEQVKPDAPFAHFGLDSADAVIIGGAMEEQFDTELDATLFLRNESIDALVSDLKQNGIIAP